MEPPERYGRHVLIERLGVGGMAEVFRAIVTGPERFHRTVVVKRILPHLSDDAAFVRMFIDEATICARLFHPNVIQIHEFGRQDGSYFLTMEYVYGRTVSGLLGRLAQRGERMPPVVAAEIARQALTGLAYAHGLTGPGGAPLHIVHRDVTPANVMVAYTGAVKVVDFGIARVTAEARIESTGAGQVKGKSAYVAPEQIKSSAPLDARVDVFSAGIVLHEMLTGARLFRGDGPVETMRLVLEKEIPAPSSVNPEVPPELDAIVMKALSRDRQGRWATAAEMAEALEAVLLERRYASGELPRLMRRLFAEEMANEHVLTADEIDAIVARVPPEPAPDPLPARTGAVPVLEEVAADSAQIVSATPSSARWRWAIVAAAVGGLAIGGFATAANRGVRPKLPPPVAAEPAPAPPPPREPAVPPAPPDPPPVPVPTTVRVAIASEPPGATVTTAAGEALGLTPVTIELPRASQEIELRVTKPGFVAATVSVVPDGDKPVALSLAPVHRASRSTRTNDEKVRLGIPQDPFAE
jgi:hypothetical protein